MFLRRFNMKNLAEELRGKYSEKEIKELIKFLKPINTRPTKKVVVKDTYNKDISMLFSIIKENKVRPCTSRCMVNEDKIIGTNLECYIIIPNKWNIPNGVYTKQMMGLKTYQDVYSDELEDFPVINLDKDGEYATYNKIELEDALNKTIFSASKSKKNLSVNAVRFAKEFMASSDTYRLVLSKLKSDLEFSLPLDSSLLLQKVLKNSNAETVEIYLSNNTVEIYVGDIMMKSKIIELAFPNVKYVIESCQFSSEITINHSSKELAEIMKKLYTISKDNSYGKNSFIFDFVKKELRAVGIDNKITIPIEFEGDIGIKAISLNAKFIEEYLKTVDLDCVKMSFKDNLSTVRVEDNYYIMPLAFQED